MTFKLKPIRGNQPPGAWDIPGSRENQGQGPDVGAILECQGNEKKPV
jgi:hypothetical protein